VQQAMTTINATLARTARTHGGGAMIATRTAAPAPKRSSKARCTPFRVDIPEAELDDLRVRLDRAR